MKKRPEPQDPDLLFLLIAGALLSLSALFWLDELLAWLLNQPPIWSPAVLP